MNGPYANGGHESVLADYLDDLLAPEFTPELEPMPVAPEPGTRYRLCSASGVALALPEDAVEPALPCPPLPTASRAGTPWYLGQAECSGRSFEVAHLGRLVAPGLSEQPATVLLPLRESDWALACDEASQMVSLCEQDVRWRKTPGNRSWLAGTVSARRVAVIDVGGMLDIFRSEANVAAVTTEENKK